MKKNKVLADEVTQNTPTISKYLKRNVLINICFSNNAKYKFSRKLIKIRLSKSQYHMRC